MIKYMDPSHPDAFVDWVKRETEHGMTKECPRCKGFGGWNLTLNAYPLHNMEDNQHNRHLYSHYRTSCGHCYGWGYVPENEACPGHKWVFVKNLGRCYNRYQCSVCGKTSDVDSGD